MAMFMNAVEMRDHELSVNKEATRYVLKVGKKIWNIK